MRRKRFQRKDLRPKAVSVVVVEVTARDSCEVSIPGMISIGVPDVHVDIRIGFIPRYAQGNSKRYVSGPR